MDDIADQTPPLVAAPRHLRRRAFHEEIPDALLVPGAAPIALVSGAGPSVQPSRERRSGNGQDLRNDSLQRQRLVALFLVILVSLTVPTLVLALIFAG